jgi:DNA-binding transcriptional regulator YhcF (GntR family)
MLISIDERDGRPIYLQIISQVREQVSQGILKPGDELPSVRELADSLGINMHTVRSAYLKLRDQGVINLRLGRRAKIADRQFSADAAAEADLEIRLKELITDALLAGYTPEGFLVLVNRQLKEIKPD